MTKDEALKLAFVIDEFDGNDESLPLELLKPIAETLRALAQPDHIVDANKMAQPAQEPVATCERCADEILESNAGLCANCLPAIFPAQEPVFKWRSVLQEMPTENSHMLFCFGVHVVEGSYTKKGWASLAYGEAQPDFWACFPPPPHHKRNQELYAMPQQRPWVGLTDEEASWCQAPSTIQTWKRIEAKLKEKNT